MPRSKSALLALISASVLVCVQIEPSRADSGYSSTYGRACWSGELGTVYHHDFIVNTRSTTYLLRGPDYVKQHCAAALSQYLAIPKFW